MKTETSQEAQPRKDDSAAAGTASGASASSAASTAFHDAAKRFAEVREYLLYYLAVQADAAKLLLRNLIFYGVLGVIALLAAGSAVVVAVALLLIGIARGIGDALNHPWLGQVIVGVAVVAFLAVAAKIGSSMVLGSSRRKTVKKYESLQRKQRTRFGHDVEDRAGAGE